MTNPLVAERQDATQWYSGLGLIESVNDTAHGIESGSWVDSTLGVAGAGLDTLGLVLDPVGSVVSWGISWLMEHVQPLSDALDSLAGDPDQITANAQTWKNVAGAMEAAARDLQDAITAEIPEWAGAASQAYRGNIGGQLESLSAISRASGAIGTGVELAGTLVGVVREIVRDLIAECIATLAVRLPMWLAEVGLTVGIGTPWVVGQVSALVAKWAKRISGFLEALIQSFRKLSPLLSKLDEIIAALKKSLRRFDGNGSTSPHSPEVDGGGHWTGARYVEDVDPQDALAYDNIRTNTADTARISENTGIPQNIVDQVKDHLFFREHDLPIGPNQTARGNFSPDPDIADLWPKAEAGTLTPDEATRFQRLLAHEYVESSLMDAGLPYRSSHPDAWHPDFGNYPTPEHHGAHDLAPLTDPSRNPFAHWERLLGREHPGIDTIAPDLSNLDSVIEQILSGGGR